MTCALLLVLRHGKTRKKEHGMADHMQVALLVVNAAVAVKWLSVDSVD